MLLKIVFLLPYKMSSPSISIIIPTKDRPVALKACLEGVDTALKQLKMAYPEDRIDSEIIVCDDSTSSKTAIIVKQAFPSITYLRGPRKGPAANRNAGVAHSNGEWLVFIDDDCMPQPQWLLELYKNFHHHTALEGCIVPQGPLKDFWKCPVNLKGGNFWSANIAVKKKLFLEVGGFDPFFPYPAYEDTDLYLRLKKRTHIPFMKASVVGHPVVYLSFREALKKEYQVLESRAYLLAKHKQGEGFRGSLKVIAREYYLCIRQVLYSLHKRFWKSSLLNSLLLLVFLPWLTLSFLKYQKLWKKS